MSKLRIRPAVSGMTLIAMSTGLAMMSDIAAAATITVNRTGDTTGPCLPTGCNLRQAIAAANATTERDTIVFNIPACGTRVINITGTTLHITRPVTIDGGSQPLCGDPIPGDRTSMIEIRGPGVAVFPGGLTLHGLVLDAGANGSVISGLAINGFSGAGIGISSNDNSIFLNKLGTDATGRQARPNTLGISLNSVTGNSISDNIVSGNAGTGIDVRADETDIFANEIGVSVDGDSLPNGGDGVSTFGGASNRIGIAASIGNVIANNLGVGVRIGLGAFNEVVGNKISNNGGVGILLQGTGANQAQVAPVITSAVRQFQIVNTNPIRFVMMTTVQGTLANAPGNTFKVDLYANDSCDPSGAGEGQKFFTTATVVNGTFSITTTAAPGAVVTGIGRSQSGNTSQFSTCRTVVQPF